MPLSPGWRTRQVTPSSAATRSFSTVIPQVQLIRCAITVADILGRSGPTRCAADRQPETRL
jgi:hypothetical protein